MKKERNQGYSRKKPAIIILHTTVRMVSWKKRVSPESTILPTTASTNRYGKAVKELGIKDDYDKRRRLHEDITGQGYDTSDIVKEGKSLFGARKKSDG